jgi:hypothetical protein
MTVIAAFGMGAVPSDVKNLAAVADERPVFVVGFVPDSLRSRLRRNELYFAYQAAAPGLIDAAAEFSLHRLKLVLPGFSIRCQF